jgi:type I phosphodiesterase/nucleotide pyrophosphatase
MRTPALCAMRTPSRCVSETARVRSATTGSRFGGQYRPPMPDALIDRLRARGFVPPDYDGAGLVNVAATVLDVLGVREDTDPPPLRALEPALGQGVRQVVVVLADGLGLAQMHALCAAGDMPFVASIIERARRRDQAQLLEATTIFPSTTAAAITTLNTARTPQEHGNLAYFVWLEEFAAVTQMLRWGPGVNRRGSFFDDQRIDPREYVKVPSVHARLRQRGGQSWVIEPEIFRNEAMTRMHAAEASFAAYYLPSSMSVRLRDLLEARPWGDAPAYLYAYWAGIDSVAHLSGPQSADHATEAALFDKALERALAPRAPGDTLVLLTADHGHAFTDPEKLIDLVGDEHLRSLLRNPIAGEPRLAFLHTDQAERVKQHLERRYPETFFFLDREEAIAAGLFGRGDPNTARQRIGEVLAMLGGDRAASIVRVDGQTFRHRGSHGGMSPEEMRIPVLAWRA